MTNPATTNDILPNDRDEHSSDADDGGPSDVDRQFKALLAGLRTSLPGAQTLFAFLLVAPFQGEFRTLSVAQQAAYSTAFYGSGLAVVLLISPSVHQRMRAPSTGLDRHSKRHLIIATWLTIVGTAAMGVATIATVHLVSSLAYSSGTALIVASAATVVIAWAWGYLPLVSFRRQ